MTNEQRATLFSIRKALDSYVEKISENVSEVNSNISIIRMWKPGIYKVGDVRGFEGIPYKCCQAHDSTMNPDWTPFLTPALWIQYHGTSEETARPWLAPTGAHDMYHVDEYMIWTDGAVWRCIQDTVHSPVDYSAAWEKCELE